MLKKTLYPALSLVALSFLFVFSFQNCKSDGKGSAALTGNNVHIRLNAEPPKLNPLTTEEVNAKTILENIFMNLLDFDPQTGALTPVLAKSLPTVATIDTGKYKGSLSYTFEILDEATWEDGSPVTAADVVFTVKAILNKKAGANNYRSTIDFVSDVLLDIANPKKFTVVAGKKYFLADVNFGTLPILSEKAYDTEGGLKAVSIADLAKSLKDSTYKIDREAIDRFANNFQSPKFSRESAGLVGAGAYKLAEWKAGERLILEKKKNWWGDKLAATNPLFQANPEQLTYKIVPEETAVTALINDGQLDAVTRVPAKKFLDMQKNDTFKTLYTFQTTQPTGLVYIGINNKDPRLNDRRVRRALAHLVDCNEFITKTLQGFAEPLAGPFIPTRSYYDKSLKQIDFNVEAAKKLLAEAGWKDTNGDSTVNKTIGGKSTEMVLRYSFASANAPAKQLGLIFQENAKKAGIKIELVNAEAKAFIDIIGKRDCELFIWNSGMMPADDDPKELWASSSNKPDGGNRCQFENKQADALIEQIRSEVNGEKRAVLYKQFQKLVYDEQPVIFLAAVKDRVLVNKRFEGMAMSRRPYYVVGTFKLKK
jgi:peptide/nickel transport system substrate-binding protein